jgi:hypothetical protein
MVPLLQARSAIRTAVPHSSVPIALSGLVVRERFSAGSRAPQMPCARAVNQLAGCWRKPAADGPRRESLARLFS